jgi:hypothetical protein
MIRLVSEPTVVEIVASMDEQLEALTQELDHLEKTRRGLTLQMDEVRRRMDELVVAKTIALSTSMSIKGRRDARSDRSAASQRSSDKVTIADAAENALREHGGEMEMADLVRQLSEAGVLRGKEQRATLSTQLIRHKHRFHREGSRWALGPQTPIPQAPAPVVNTGASTAPSIGLDTSAVTAIGEFLRKLLTTPAPTLPAVKMPVLPHISAPVIPEVKMPVLPTMPGPVIPEVKMPVLPHISAPVIPEVKMPVLPPIQMPVIPAAGSGGSKAATLDAHRHD